jgi:hypothetical protein
VLQGLRVLPELYVVDVVGNHKRDTFIALKRVCPGE